MKATIEETILHMKKWWTDSCFRW